MKLVKTIIRLITKPSLPREWIPELVKGSCGESVEMSDVPETPEVEGDGYVVYEIKIKDEELE